MLQMFDSPREAMAHMTALHLIAIADGKIDSKEKGYIDNLLAIYKERYPELGSIQVDPELGSLNELLSQMDTRKRKMVLIQDLFSMASVDGKIDFAEQAEIVKIATILKVDKKEVEKLAELNLFLLNANKELAEFIFGTSPDEGA